ncbi:MAG TPA: hypothetical protein VGT60_10035 [Candidatus Limnocylindria bacterium]|nr:hypothetical protein [Candidatus Limnocylindria bacterium]
MRISARQRQLERLAWAGGFFDGEGSTFARSLAARPGYLQLNVVVAQSGAFVVPEVLVRFDEALPGLGQISRPSGGMFYWRATDYSGSRAVLQLLRPWIGTVKRDQANTAIAAVETQYSSGRYRARPGRRRTGIAPERAPASITAAQRVRLDRAWAAGFLDGEGCFGLVRSHPRVGGRPWYRIRASSTQHGAVGIPAPVLRKLLRVVRVGHIECHGEPDDFKWVAEGVSAIEHVLKVVGPWLGAVKRAQARDVMAAFTAQVRLKGGSTQCIRGHTYDRVARRRNGTVHRRCNACARLLGRRTRAALGIPPRPFKNPARRYTE